MSKKKSKRKISKKKIFTFLVFVAIIIFICNLVTTNITNIYISGNTFFSDQEIIDIAGLSDYPKSLYNFSFSIEKKLKENKYISNVNIKKNILLNKVYIEIDENYPLFYYQTKDVTILYNCEEEKDNLSELTVINSIPDDIYNEFLLEIKKIKINILNRISEIEYVPTDVIKNRFLLLMNDGNYVYITLDKFKSINKYIDIIKEFEGKKGILYLDSGKYFDVLENEIT